MTILLASGRSYVREGRSKPNTSDRWKWRGARQARAVGGGCRFVMAPRDDRVLVRHRRIGLRGLVAVERRPSVGRAARSETCAEPIDFRVLDSGGLMAVERSPSVGRASRVTGST
jgi:hypothetical protein